MSSGSSVSSLSASSRGSNSSLSSTDNYLNQYSSESNSIQDLFQKVLGHNFPSDHLSSSQQDSLGNLETIGENEVYDSYQQPPPSYHNHVQLDPHNLSEKLTQLNQQASSSNPQHWQIYVPHLSLVPVKTDYSNYPHTYVNSNYQSLSSLQQSMEAEHHLCQPPVESTESKTTDLSSLSSSVVNIFNPPLSPTSESSSGVCHTASGGVPTRNVSAAVSNESMAGDSGVFEASKKKSELELENLGIQTAQIQIKLQYVKKCCLMSYLMKDFSVTHISKLQLNLDSIYMVVKNH